jgi:PAS domain S-box-containing protein
MISLKETKRLKDAIAANPADFMTVIEDTQLCVCITNETGHFVTANSHYLKNYGYTLEELKGKHFTVVLPPEKVESLSRAHDNFIQNKYEILRKWQVMAQDGRVMEITADAMYTEEILDNKPHKVTFVHIENAKAGQVNLTEGVQKVHG